MMMLMDNYLMIITIPWKSMDIIMHIYITVYLGLLFNDYWYFYGRVAVYLIPFQRPSGPSSPQQWQSPCRPCPCRPPRRRWSAVGLGATASNFDMVKTSYGVRYVYDVYDIYDVYIWYIYIWYILYGIWMDMEMEIDMGMETWMKILIWRWIYIEIEWDWYGWIWSSI